ncbi:MAG: thioredoxin family protein [Spirochaetales bacterium]|nr:thioredoxin family protein [Spirochaetales bacterium]
MKKISLCLFLLTMIFGCKKDETEIFLVDITEKDFVENVFDFNDSQDVVLERPIFVYLYSDASPSCSVALPAVEKVAEKFHKKVDFYKINVIFTNKFLENFDIHVAPSYLFIKGNSSDAAVRKEFGVIDSDILKEFIVQEFDL